MQINQHMKAILRAPLTAKIQIVKTILLRSSVFLFKKDIVHRHPYMIKAQRSNLPDILFCDKGVKMRSIIGFKLRYLAAQIHALLESVNFFHTSSCLPPCMGKNPGKRIKTTLAQDGHADIGNVIIPKTVDVFA